MSYTCYNCFKQKPTGGVCPFCGYDDSNAVKDFPLALKPGSILNGRYTVGRVLGQGGFGITYIAQDYQSGERVAIKEYLPSEFAGREPENNSVRVHSSNQRENYEYGKAQFLEEARTLAAFNGDEHIVRIHSYFEENNTAYFVMEYVDGAALDKYLAQKGGRLSVEEANRLLLPLMESLGKVHAKGIIHRDIAPDNIIITKEGAAKLIDFGAARYSTGEKSKSLDVVLKHGFAPTEQYMRRGRQGPFTDVYALAATYYYAITGKVLPDAVERMQEDTMFVPSALGVKISPEQEDALLKALEINTGDRYQNMAEFHREMAAASPRLQEKQSEIEQTVQEAKAEVELLERRAREARAKVTRLEQEKAGKAEGLKPDHKSEQNGHPPETKEAPKQTSSAKKRTKLASILVALALVIAAAILLPGKLRTPQINEPIPTTEVQPEVPAESVAPTPTPTPEIDEFAAFKTVGNVVTFGSYEQDNNLDNGPEPIEWIVLDVQEEKSLLISKYGLASRKYANGGDIIAWQISDLKEWLHFVFAPDAFDANETSRLLKTKVDNSDKQGNSEWNTTGGNDTTDVFFPLSWTEIQDYMPSAEGRVLSLTPYAEAHRENLTLVGGKAGWWLRSPGPQQNAVAVVDTSGRLKFNSPAMMEAARPAVWIDTRLNSERAEAQRIDEERNHTSLIGSTVRFGRYEQDHNKENGPEPIEWLVIDAKGGRAKLLSKYTLDGQPYNSFDAKNITWENCTLRKWLNEQFYSSAFTADEQNSILETNVDNSRSQGMSLSNYLGGNDTEDNVFLLSDAEIEDVMIDNYVFNRFDYFRPSSITANGNRDYKCIENSPYESSEIDYWASPYGFAYDRTPFDYRNSAKGALHPVMWVDINALIDGENNLEDSHVSEEPSEQKAAPVADEPSVSSIQQQEQREGELEGFKSIGNIVTFGHYEQDGNLNNGPESIEWLVLDVQDGKSLLLSKYALDRQKFDTHNKVFWCDSAIRKWMNNEFFQSAFDDDEKNTILLIELNNNEEVVENEWQTVISSENTWDQVFLLNETEVNKYLPVEEERCCKATAYVKMHNAWTDDEDTCEWWLRSLSSWNGFVHVSLVTLTGIIHGNNANYDHVAIRPAIWVTTD